MKEYLIYEPVVPSTTRFVINDNSNFTWGVLFFKQIRFWNCFDCVSRDLYYRQIISPDSYINLINLFDPTYNSSNTITDLSNNITHKTGTFNASVKSNFIGYNLITNQANLKINLCPQTDTTNKQCYSTFSLTKVNYITFSRVPVSFYGRYTMEFWYYVEDVRILKEGFVLSWSKQIAISAITYSNTFQLYLSCFPQEHKDSPYQKSGTTLSTFTGTAENVTNLTVDNISHQWSYIRCSYSYDNSEYYMGDSGIKTVKNVDKFYFSPGSVGYLYLTSSPLQKTNFYIQKINLYSEYLPVTYSTRYLY